MPISVILCVHKSIMLNDDLDNQTFVSFPGLGFRLQRTFTDLRENHVRFGLQVGIKWM